MSRYIFIPTYFEIKHWIIWGHESVQSIFTSFAWYYWRIWSGVEVNGFNTRYLGTQSFRKGVLLMVSDGFAGSPPIALLCTMCGWYIVMIKEIYLKYEAVEYQYVVYCAYYIDKTKNVCMIITFIWFLLSPNLTRILC